MGEEWTESENERRYDISILVHFKTQIQTEWDGRHLTSHGLSPEDEPKVYVYSFINVRASSGLY